jgi:hypothetical protein
MQFEVDAHKDRFQWWRWHGSGECIFPTPIKMVGSRAKRLFIAGKDSTNIYLPQASTQRILCAPTYPAAQQVGNC